MDCDKPDTAKMIQNPPSVTALICCSTLLKFIIWNLLIDLIHHLLYLKRIQVLTQETIERKYKDGKKKP